MAMRRIYVGDKQFYPILILWLVQNANANQKTIEKLKEYQEINTLKNHTEYSELSEDVTSEYDTKTFHISHIDEEKDKNEIEVQHCGCKKTISTNYIIHGDSNIVFNQTTCSKNAFLRGNGQKIVGYSYFPPATPTLAVFSRIKNYIGGIKRNLMMMPIYYYGWIMRLYVDFGQLNQVQYRSMKDELCELACTYPNFDICDVSNLPGTPVEDASKIFAKNWRFFPTLDPQVDIFVSRDLDCKFTERENAAVLEWIESGQYFHTMRDRLQHDYWPIMAGIWGTKLSDATFRYNWTVAWKQAMKDDMMHVTQDHFDEDQQFLMRYIWPWVKEYSMSHDSYFCEDFPNTRPFPVQRKEKQPNNYVGAGSDDHIVTEECPLACRPKNHPDWILC